MNATLHMRNGRAFCFGFVQRVFSDGDRLFVYADLGETATIRTRHFGSATGGIDEMTRFDLRDVREIELDDEPSTARMAIR